MYLFIYLFYTAQPVSSKVCKLPRNWGLIYGKNTTYPCYGLDGQWIESSWGKIFRTRPDQPWSPGSLQDSGYRVILGDKMVGRCVTPRPHQALTLKKE
jgi:hypothetical protein